MNHTAPTINDEIRDNPNKKTIMSTENDRKILGKKLINQIAPKVTNYNIISKNLSAPRTQDANKYIHS